MVHQPWYGHLFCRHNDGRFHISPLKQIRVVAHLEWQVHCNTESHAPPTLTPHPLSHPIHFHTTPTFISHPLSHPHLSELHDQVEEVRGGVLGRGVAGGGGRVEEVLYGDPLSKPMVQPSLPHREIAGEMDFNLMQRRE